MSPFLGALERLVLIRDGCYAPSARIRQRAAIILGLDRGMAAAAVARGAGCHRTTVYYWLRLYQKYRDFKALTGEEPRRPVKKRPTGQGGRADAVNALSRYPSRPRPVSLLVGFHAQRHLRWAAHWRDDPGRKLDAAIAWARLRGVEPIRIARAAGISPQAAYRAWRRALLVAER